jgi:hypothetical protein
MSTFNMTESVQSIGTTPRLIPRANGVQFDEEDQAYVKANYPDDYAKFFAQFEKSTLTAFSLLSADPWARTLTGIRLGSLLLLSLIEPPYE